MKLLLCVYANSLIYSFSDRSLCIRNFIIVGTTFTTVNDLWPLDSRDVEL